MPTYEYRCKSCGHEMEVQQAFTDDPLDTCPECEGPLRKVYGNVGIAFKGSGFYKNDARGSSKKSASSSSGSTTSDTSGSSTDKKPSETKTETKAAPAASSSD
ncbi:FmdB family transcriptional regulator [Acidimicrobiia bacterium EGI L10123]|uniref:FmdB family zinc ribbon protein n=1 Tax=Salinilacustrithrix flava TaxID=2957203 RepID=UPI003D7C24E1|nr:FmdB family transcriptional regulator [Acidimicrobiia bacterium EGI L10123]